MMNKSQVNLIFQFQQKVPKYNECEIIFISDLFKSGSPFLCRVNDGGSDIGGSGMSYGSGNSKVTLDLEHLGLIPVAVPSHFTIRVAGGDDAELAVSVQGKYMY